MKFEYRRQLSDGTVKTSRFDGWIAAVVAALVLIGVAALIILFIPFLIAGILIFIAFLIFLLLGGWLYVGYKIGFRNMWELTKMGFGWRSAGNWRAFQDRMMKEWENRSKGRDGIWMGPPSS